MAKLKQATSSSCTFLTERETNLSLSKLLAEFGSDKSIAHNYELVYEPILLKLSGQDTIIFELGLGSIDPSIPSNMLHFKNRAMPGGSLRAFREFVPGATILGADIDVKTLVNEERIESCWVDQTDPKSFVHLMNLINKRSLDIIIIDGLHQPYADIVSLVKLLPWLKISGSLFVEDIRNLQSILLFWKLVGLILTLKRFRCTSHKLKGGIVFQVTRLR